MHLVKSQTMPPTSSSPVKGLSADQITLLTEVVSRSNLSLTMDEWNSLADDLKISNGKAAKERFRYMMKNLNIACNQTTPLTPTSARSSRKVTGADTKSNNGKTQTSMAKKRSTPVKARCISMKKVKLGNPVKQEDYIASDVLVPAAEAEDENDELAVSCDEQKNSIASVDGDAVADADVGVGTGVNVEVTGVLNGLEYGELRNAIQEDDLDGLFDRMEQGIQQAGHGLLYEQED